MYSGFATQAFGGQPAYGYGGLPMGSAMPIGGPGFQGAAPSNFRPGDWICGGCGDHKHAYRNECQHCGTVRPQNYEDDRRGGGGGGGYGDRDRGGRYDDDRRGGGGGGRDRDRGDYRDFRDSGGGGRGGNAGSGGGGRGGGNFRPGDWYCPSCNDHKYAYREECNRCGVRRPPEDQRMGPGGGGGGGGRDHLSHRDSHREPKHMRAAKGAYRQGDWLCPGCNEVKFAFRDSCEKCTVEKKPEYEQAAERRNREQLDLGLPSSFRPGDWMCPTCNAHKFASRSVCEKCQTPKPVDASGATIPIKVFTPAQLVEEACDLSSALNKFELLVAGPVSASQCQLRPANSAALLGQLGAVAKILQRALKVDAQGTMEALEANCNAFSNGLQYMSITSENVDWLPTAQDGMGINLQGASPECLARCELAFQNAERIETKPTALVPLHESGNVATRSPLLVFKMANDAGKEAACVAVHVALNGDVAALRPSDSPYFFVELARFHAK